MNNEFKQAAKEVIKYVSEKFPNWSLEELNLLLEEVANMLNELSKVKFLVQSIHKLEVENHKVGLDRIFAESGAKSVARDFLNKMIDVLGNIISNFDVENDILYTLYNRGIVDNKTTICFKALYTLVHNLKQVPNLPKGLLDDINVVFGTQLDVYSCKEVKVDHFVKIKEDLENIINKYYNDKEIEKIDQELRDNDKS